MDTPQRDDPIDPLTELGGAAVSLHEIYQELLRAGFDERHALHYTTAVLLEPLRAQVAPCPHCGLTRGLA